MPLWTDVQQLRAAGRWAEAQALLASSIDTIPPQEAADLADLAVTLHAWSLAQRLLELVPTGEDKDLVAAKLAYVQQRLSDPHLSANGLTASPQASLEARLITLATSLDRAVKAERWPQAAATASRLLQLDEQADRLIAPFYQAIRDYAIIQCIVLMLMADRSPALHQLFHTLTTDSPIMSEITAIRDLLGVLLVEPEWDDLLIPALRSAYPFPTWLPGPFRDQLQTIASLLDDPDLDQIAQVEAVLPGLRLAARFGEAALVPPSHSSAPESDLRVAFTPLTGASWISGSSHLLQMGDLNLLLDIGLDVNIAVDEAYQTFKTRLVEALPGGLSDLYALLISHAHTDHIGLLPMLYRDPDLEWIQTTTGRKPKLRIYGSPSSSALAKVMLRDMAHIQAQSTQAFTESDAAAAANALEPYPRNGKLHSFRELGQITTFAAGHILGSQMLLIERAGVRVLFSGDINTLQQATIDPLAKIDEPVDLLVMEHTYGSGQSGFSGQRAWQEQAFKDGLSEVIQAGGSVVVPAFAVGRSQEILALVAEHARENPEFVYSVILDGLSRTITAVYDNHPRETTERYKDARSWLDRRRLAIVQPGEDREDVLRRIEDEQANGTPSVVIASSGMLKTGSASYHYAQGLAWNPANAIFLTGYTSEDSEAGILLKRKRDALDELGLEVRCRVERYHFTAHAPRSGLLDFVAQVRPRHIVLVHGDAERSLADPHSVYNTLQHAGYSVHLGHEGRTYRYFQGELEG
ncbi:MAG: MBL fold metallo-hydrolase [Chloroflexi bacterium]|nr:MBL fold metallo-hydrolase [Chloroflexota bacterium]